MPYIVSVGYEITPPVLRISAALFISLSCGLSGFICINVTASLKNIFHQRIQRKNEKQQASPDNSPQGAKGNILALKGKEVNCRLLIP